jgi:hypothetical protein
MVRIRRKNQSGAALILFVVISMAMGGLLFVNFTQDALKLAKEKRFEHNKRVLKEAKQALLMYAYNYPELTIPAYENITPSRGPGRLPCPDNNNDGLVYNPATDGSISLFPDYDSNGTVEFSESATYCNFVGRLPWRDLNDYDAKDADGESLWYAVSAEFRNIAPVDPDDLTPEDDLGDETIVNSGSGFNKNNITIIDQSGNIMYQGGVAGIAAVIIAPGAAIARDENSDGIYEYQQVRTGGQANLARNYLDTGNGVDNSTFTSGELFPNTNGFILGPIKETDPNSPAVNTVVVNDQIIIIRAEEIIAMAEKATLQAYRNAITDYWCADEVPPASGTTQALCIANGGTWIGYPWLYNYAGVLDVPGLSSDFGGTSGFQTELLSNLGNIGRIPTITPLTYIGYFTATAVPVNDTDLSISRSFTFPSTAIVVETDENSELSASLISQSFNYQTTNKLTGVNFSNIGQNGRLTGTATTETLTHDIYYWDDYDTPTTIWTPCGDDGDGVAQVSDCHRTDGEPTPGGNNENNEWILHVMVDFDVNDPVVYDMDFSNVVINHVAASSSAHASITGEFPSADIITPPVLSGIRYEIDWDYLADDPFPVPPRTFVSDKSGTLNLAELTQEGPLTLGLRYYPELPNWVIENNWHNSILMAYAPGYIPGGSGSCTPENGDVAIGAADDCIVVNNLGGINNNVISLIAIAGEHDWVDDGVDSNGDGDFVDPGNDDNLDGDYCDPGEILPDKEAGDGYGNELHNVFEAENYSGIDLWPPCPSGTGLDLVFDKRTKPETGDTSDTIFILEQL